MHKPKARSARFSIPGTQTGEQTSDQVSCSCCLVEPSIYILDGFRVARRSSFIFCLSSVSLLAHPSAFSFFFAKVTRVPSVSIILSSCPCFYEVAWYKTINLWSLCVLIRDGKVMGADQLFVFQVLDEPIVWSRVSVSVCLEMVAAVHHSPSPIIFAMLFIFKLNFAEGADAS